MKMSTIVVWFGGMEWVLLCLVQRNRYCNSIKKKVEMNNMGNYLTHC